MEAAEFTIFEPFNKSAWLTPNIIILLMYGTAIGGFWLSDDVLKIGEYVDSFIKIYLGLIIIVTLYFAVTSFFTYKPLNGKFSGEIKFKNDEIIVNDKVYNLKDINDLNFSLRDFYGKSSGSGRDLNAKLSQGVNNFVTFTDKAQQTQLIYFMLKNDHHLNVLSGFVTQAVKDKKMLFKDGIDLLGIGNMPI